ncbi:MAG: zinc-dependent metalloprotease, partial [Rhodothermales bacterium]
FKPYDKVIEDDFETDDGLFAVHRDGEKLFYEIPDSLLDVEMLLVSRIARTADNIGYGGEKAGTQVVRWQRQGDQVLLRIVSYENVADEDEPIYEAVRNANFEPIIQAFDIEALAKDSAGVVIEVTDLFAEDVPVLGLQKSRRERYKVRSLDEDRSFIASAKSYPQNIEVRSVLTYEAQEPPSNAQTNAISLEMNHSMVLLPAEPMQPRLYDERVGYFSVEQTDYSLDEQKAAKRRYITRWRLEPSDTAAFRRGELVEPKKPIVYYIDPATPPKWRPYIKQGVADWNSAFEAAGFKNAIMAKDPPSVEEDSTFSPEDVRYSVIRYFPSETQNAYGPHVHDPRTGEILESDIGWFHNVMNLLRNWYFVQTAAVNPQAQGVKFEDEVMGELVRFVSAHEVGHTLGLPHNWGSSFAYPVDSLRSPAFTDAHGTAPSIMDYARFNYIAQPEDGVTQLMPRIGEYDVYAIEWGYRPLPDAGSPEAERSTLNAWVREHEDDPAYFYGRSTGGRIDPRSQNEDLGDDAALASLYGLENLKRILPNLIEWTEEEGKNYDDLEELYEQVIGQWNRYMGHVARRIGGVYETPRTYDQDGVVYEPVPKVRQEAAMAFLQEHAFTRPDWMLDEAILRRIEHAGALERIRQAQTSVLGLVLDPQRLARLIEAEALQGEATYTPAEMMDDLRAGLWSELSRGEPINVFRRNLQRGYLERLGELMTEEVDAPPAAVQSAIGFTPVDVSQSDVRPYVRGELLILQEEIGQALPRVGDRATELHLRDVQARIDEMLDPEG